jgi:NADH:ubiquinone oxidoreductase subunit F (NADH-binding)
LGDAAAWPVQSMIKRFRDEFEKRAMKSSRVVANESVTA